MSSTTPETAEAVRCAYPGCENEPRADEHTVGAKPKYCGRPDPVTGKPHSALTAFRRRQELRQGAGEAGVTTDADAEQPVTMARETGAELLRQMRDLAAKLADVTGRLTGAVTTLGDPAAAEAEIEAARIAADQRAGAAEAERAEAIRRAIAADQLRAEADEAAGQMSEHLAAEQARAREAHDRLAEDARAETTRVRQDAARELEQLRASTEREREQLTGRLAEAQAENRAARQRLDEQAAAHAAELAQVRADAAREREELRGALDSRARVLEESRAELRTRAERAERDLDAARAELDKARQQAGTPGTPSARQRRTT